MDFFMMKPPYFFRDDWDRGAVQRPPSSQAARSPGASRIDRSTLPPVFRDPAGWFHSGERISILTNEFLPPVYFLPSKSLLAAGAPSAEISTLYLPTGQPLGFEMWNSVLAGPVGARSRSSSLTTWPALPKVHLACSFTEGAVPSVATEA